MLKYLHVFGSRRQTMPSPPTSSDVLDVILYASNLLDLNSLWVLCNNSTLYFAPVAACGTFVIVATGEGSIFKGVGRLGLR
mmetsp:Transcript_3630/g.10334  ORF Transcript_3630/g.10334 Transcript_3630/m.10334 type:complete len:81 (-) Transcript_3630:4203-4445(-)